MSDIKNEIVQVDYVEVDKITYYTAVQVAEEIEEPVSTVRSWAGKDFGEILEVERVNGRKCFTKEDIKRLKFIKELRKGNMSINQIKDYIDKHGFKYANYDSGLVDVKDPLGFQALASALSVEVDNKLNLFMDRLMGELVNQVGEVNKKQLEYMSQEITESLLETLDSKISDIECAIDKSTKEISTTVDDVMSDKFESLENSVNEIKESIRIAYVTNEQITKKSNGNIITKIRRLLNKDIV